MRILITGAAGLIGGEVAHRLAARGHAVTAAVHRNHAVLANDGAAVPVAGMVTIDLAAPELGLDADTAAVIARDHDLIIHCAATTRFDLAEADYRAVNIGGTANIVALARRGNVPLLHVSTAYVCGARGGTIGEDGPLPDSGFANGYEASKAEGERIVAASGLPHAIARPSIVVGDSRTGAIRTFDTIYAAFRLIALGHIRHMPARHDATLDFVPVDHVAAGIAAIAGNMAGTGGRRYHLVSGNPVPVAAWADAIGSYPHFHRPALIAPDRFDPATLSPRERRLHNRVAGLYASYFQRAPRFDDSAFRGLTGLACPPTDARYLRRLIDHCIATGFLPPA